MAVGRLVRSYFANLPYLFNPWVAESAALRELFALYNFHSMAHRPAIIRALMFVPSLLIWPLMSVYHGLVVLRSEGAHVQQLSAKGRIRQFFEILYLCNTYLVHPNTYYLLRLWEPERRRQLGWMIPDGKAQRLFHTMYQQTDDSGQYDKEGFYERCVQHGFPIPRPAAVFKGGAATFANGEARLPDVDLVFKHRDGKGGAGFARFDTLGNQSYRCALTGETITASELIKRYEAKSQEQDYLAQSRLKNHRDIADLGNHALSTSRIITARTASGEFEVISAILCVPTGDSLVSNGGNRSLVCSVDIASGVLSEAYSRQPPLRSEFRDTTDVGTRIRGRVLPYWQQIKELVLDAHAKVSTVPIDGWDVAITDDGPVILECNMNLGLNGHQHHSHVLLGKTEFPAIMLYHMRLKLAAITSSRSPGTA